MKWRSILAALMGVAAVVAAVLWLTPYLQSLIMVRQMSNGAEFLNSGWGLLREPALWPLIAVGLVVGWFLGHVEGLWTGADAARADWQAAQEALDDEKAQQRRCAAQEQLNLDQARAEVEEARQMALRSQQAADAERARLAAAQQEWKRWASAEVAKAQAETAEAQRRSRNAVGAAERRKRQLKRVFSERSHTA